MLILEPTWVAPLNIQTSAGKYVCNTILAGTRMQKGVVCTVLHSLLLSKLDLGRAGSIPTSSSTTIN